MTSSSSEHLPWYSNSFLAGRLWARFKSALFVYGAGSDQIKFFRWKRKLQLYAARCGAYEKPFFQNIERMLNPGMVAIDIGAHLGVYTERMLQLVEGTGHVVAVEPLPMLSRILESEYSQRDNVTVRNVALSDNIAAQEIWIPLINGIYPEPALASLVRQDENSIAAAIETSTAKDFFSSFSKIDFIKIDAEGHEASILQNAREILSCLRPIIQIEISESCVVRERIDNYFGLREYTAYDADLQAIALGCSLPHMCYLVPAERSIP